MRRAGVHTGRAAARGTVLIVTMWIMLVLAGLVLALARVMRVECVCSGNIAAIIQAEAIEQGAIQYVLASVDSLNGKLPTEANMPCEAVRLGEGAFWILRPPNEDEGETTRAYGVIDEASKVNLNTAPAPVLELLPQMTSELAASIVDWRDSDTTASPGGAESEYYLLLPDPYQCKDAPIESVQELLLVKDVDRQVLYGEDLNRNGVLDENEDDGNAAEPPDNADGRLDHGLADFVTAWSAEPNTAPDGSTKINVNGDTTTQQLVDLLTKHVSQNRLAVVLDRARRERPFQNVMDFCLKCALTKEEAAAIADYLTTREGGAASGLINVNTAPREVLACLPGLTEADVSALLSHRAESAEPPSGVGWVFGALNAEKAVGIGDLITGFSYQFSADIVSVSGNGRAFRRCRVIVDASVSPPKVIYRRDLTGLGWPLDEEILTQLRAGVGLDQLAAPTRTTLTGD